MLRPLRLPVLLAALAASGCGASGTGGDTARDDARQRAAKPAHALEVVPTDGRVGDATAATSAEGLTQLRVDRRRPRPDAVREGVGAGASCADAELLPDAGNLPAVAAATLCLVNGERADAGLTALSPNGKLDQSSVGHSQDMVARQYFAHEGQDGRDVIARVRATGYIPERVQWTVGENLAWGTGTLATPRAIVQSWMESQGHRENILRSGFREAGLGIAIGNPRAANGQGATFTMNFGSVGQSATNRLVSTTTGSGAGAVPRQSAATRRSAASRRAAARRRACRAKARRARAATSRSRKARIARCARSSRRR